jgi:hypothetical protein
VPESDDIPTLLTQLELLAKREKVRFTSYSVDASGASSSTAAPAETGTTPSATATGTRSTDTVAPLYTPGSVEVSGGLARTPIAIKLTGTYFHLERYLRSVQRFAVISAKRTDAKGRLIIVDGFSYAPIGGETVTADVKDKKLVVKESRSPLLNASLSASVYYAPPVTAPPTTGSGAADPSAATPAAGATPSTSTGAAAVGGLR